MIRRIAAIFSLLALLSLGAQPASAQDEAPEDATSTSSSDGPGALVTRGQGHALGAQFVLSRPNTIPFDPILDAAVGLATGSLDEQSGQSTATASALYPGDVLSAPAAFVPLIGFPVGGQLLPPDHPISELYFTLPTLVPPYPLVTRSSFPGQPGRRVDALGDLVNQVPVGLPLDVLAAVQESTAAEDFVSAKTTLARASLAGLPGILPVPQLGSAIDTLNRFIRPFVGEAPGLSGSLAEVAAMESTFEVSDDGRAAVTTASTTIGEVQFAGGLVRLGPMRAIASQSAVPGSRTVRSHVVEVGSIKVLGIEVRVTDDGVTVVDQRIPAGAAGTVSDQLNDILSQAGVRIELPSRRAEGDSLAAQVLSLSIKASNPTIPGVLPEGETTITLRLGDVLSGLEVTAGSAGEGDATSFDDTSFDEFSDTSSDFDDGLGSSDFGGDSGMGFDLGSDADSFLLSSGDAGGDSSVGGGGEAVASGPIDTGGNKRKVALAATPVASSLQSLSNTMAAFTMVGLLGALWGWRRRFGRAALPV